MKDIIREGHDTLKKVAKEVSLPMSTSDKQTLYSMFEYLKNSQDEQISKEYQIRPGVGLAAPQIDVSKRMLAIHATDETGEHLSSYMLVNPKILSHSEELTYLATGEGCLSIDREVPGHVLRYKKITVTGYQLKEDGELEMITIRLKGYVSIVFQHEIDHLNGILFTDRIDPEQPFNLDTSIKPIEF